MLKTILSVSGKSGLFKLISSAKNMIVVESLVDKKRIPVHAKDKVVSLGDIAMYTAEGEEPLKNVLANIKKKENGGKTSITSSANPEELFAYFKEVLPSFDKERVYPTDVKKLLNWYNLLIDCGIDFEQTDAEETTESAEKNESVEVAEVKKAPAKPKARAKSTAAAAAKPVSDAKVSQRGTRKKV